jgi:hypothetical protein
MKNNVDCEIYISGFINFFEKNPNDLSNLIGEMNKEKFFMEVRITVYQNFDKGEEITLTQQQLLDILIKLHGKEKKAKEIEVMVPIHRTKWGEFILN